MRRINPGSRERTLVAAVVMLLSLTGAGCVSQSVPEYATHDSLEGANRVSYRVTDWVDRKALAPVARGYSRITPDWWRTGVTNVFANLRNIDSSLNSLLQGKPRKSGTDLLRVVVNSTIGIGGVMDVATRLGLQYGDEDLGQTFAVWGNTRTPYLFLPAAGPSTVRDLPGNLIKGWTPRLLIGGYYNIWIGVLDGINARAQALSLTDARDSSALDGYVFTRDAYFQRRKFLIFDGDPPLDDFFDEDFGDDEFEDDFQESSGLDAPGAANLNATPTGALILDVSAEVVDTAY